LANNVIKAKTAAHPKTSCSDHFVLACKWLCLITNDEGHMPAAINPIKATTPSLCKPLIDYTGTAKTITTKRNMPPW
jgi:hypothetical protein